MALIFEELEAAFGTECLAPALFYAHTPALRFELAGGKTRVGQFLQAHHRAQTILASAFAESEPLVVVLTVYSDQSAHKLWKRVSKSLARLGIVQMKIPEFRRTQQDEIPQTQFAFMVPTARFPELLWGTLAADLGISPALVGRLTLAAPALGLLACPYDSRGLDIIGSAARLAELYTAFNPWLLDYDRPAMDTMFGTPTSFSGS